MAYLPKKEVLEYIRKRKHTVKGTEYTVYEAYFGTEPWTKKAVRKYSCSLDGIKQVINDFYTRLGRGGDASVVLNPYQAYDAKTALDLLSNAQMSISLTECVKRVLEASKVGISQCKISLSDAYEKYLESFGDNQDLQIRTVRTRVGSFVTAFGENKFLTDIDPKWLAEYLKRDHGNSNKTYNNYLSYIKTFVNWCTKPEQGWIKENPLVGMSVKPVEYKEPEFVRADDVRKLFAELEKHDRAILAYAICSFFMGLRREEILRGAQDSEDAIYFAIDKKMVVVRKPKGHTKGIMPRSFSIIDNAQKWVESFDFLGALARVTEKTSDKVKEIAKDLGVNIPRNAGRHTFISMHCAAFGEPQKTEAMVGTSRKMRINNYCGISIPKEEAIGYFQIVPSVDSLK